MSRYQIPFFKWLLRHWLCSYVLMGLSFVLFGVTSLNLVQVFTANISFLSSYGLDAVRDGGLMQFVELLASTYLAVAFYLLLKTCEHALVERAAHHQDQKK